jgi:hypothetical protein
MGTLVDEKAATISLVPMPSSEIVCSMDSVEHPLEVNTGDSADLPGPNEVKYFGVMACIAIIKGYPYVLLGALHCIEDGKATRDVNGHGFLGYDIAAKF